MPSKKVRPKSSPNDIRERAHSVDLIPDELANLAQAMEATLGVLQHRRLIRSASMQHHSRAPPRTGPESDQLVQRVAEARLCVQHRANSSTRHRVQVRRLERPQASFAREPRYDLPLAHDLTSLYLDGVLGVIRRRTTHLNGPAHDHVEVVRLISFQVDVRSRRQTNLFERGHDLGRSCLTQQRKEILRVELVGDIPSRRHLAHDRLFMLEDIRRHPLTSSPDLPHHRQSSTERCTTIAHIPGATGPRGPQAALAAVSPP